MKKFEYKFELDAGARDGEETDYTEEELNKFGSEGWELVAVSLCGKDNSYLGFWFKREIDSK